MTSYPAGFSGLYTGCMRAVRGLYAESPCSQYIIGYFKSETGEKPIYEFVGLRAKAYSCRLASDGVEDKHMRLKGVGKSAIKI